MDLKLKILQKVKYTLFLAALREWHFKSEKGNYNLNIFSLLIYMKIFIEIKHIILLITFYFLTILSYFLAFYSKKPISLFYAKSLY
jgi:hypothetical protein